MVSVPVEPEGNNDPESVFGDDVRPFLMETNNSNIYSYDETSNAWSIPSVIQNGIGYILYCFNADILDVSGLEMTADITKTLTYTNSSGWHLLGNPYRTSIDWDSDVTRGSGISGTYYRWTGSYYDNYPYGDLTKDIGRWEGFWVNTLSDGAELTISYPGLSKKAEQKITRPVIDWRVQISAESGSNKDIHNYIGVSLDAENEFDAADVYELVPLNYEYVSLYFPHMEWSNKQGNYTQDIRTFSEDKSVWDFVVAANSSNDEITLKWDIPDEMDENIKITLSNEENNIFINMREQSKYKYRILPSLNKSVEQELNISADPADFSRKLAKGCSNLNNFSITVEKPAAVKIPEIYYLNQNYPNPFNPSTTIEYGLKETGNVSLKVYNILGQEVKSLLNVQQEAGIHRVIWDGIDNNGIQAASGIYFYRISVNNYQEIKKLILLR